MKINKRALFILCAFLVFGNSCMPEDVEKNVIPLPDQEDLQEVEEGEDNADEDYYKIRVLTYNVFHGEATNGKIDMDLFGEIIKAESPDLVALQEVDRNTTRTGGTDITAELSTRTGLSGYFGAFRNYDGGQYGAAILSKFPVLDTEVRKKYTLEGSPASTHFIAKIKIAEDKTIYFNSSHLSTTFEEREEQVKELVKYYQETIDQAPILIAGDLNAEAADPEMAPFFEHFAISDVALKNTFSTRTGMRKKIDFVLYPKNDDWKVFEVKQICRGDASDHCALLVVLGYKK